MECPFPLASVLGAPSDTSGTPFVGRIDDRLLQGKWGRELCTLLDSMGKASAAAQGLRKPVTCGTPHLLGQRLYLLVSGRTALGFLKVGEKRLFVAAPLVATRNGNQQRSDVRDALLEINPVCALDFYVHETCQRNGFGRRLFDAMLRCEKLQPVQLAYDKPSPKLVAFLAKHFGLTKFRPQNNNYVIFDEYFESSIAGPPGNLPRSQSVETSYPALPKQRFGSSCSGNAPGIHSAAVEPPWGTHCSGPKTERGSSSRSVAVRPSSRCSRAPSGGHLQQSPELPPAGMPSQACGPRERSASMSGSRIRRDSGGADPSIPAAGVSAVAGAWGRHATAGGASNRFASPLSHVGRSLIMRE